VPANVVYPPIVRRRSIMETRPTVFLGGSIEQGAATDWQQEAITGLSTVASLLFNPRRPEWDPTWEQTIDSANFNSQVNWELDAIMAADYVLLNFEAGTKSPITLQEHGICAALKPEKTFVACPPEFWRAGNVEIVSERFGMRFFNRLAPALLELGQELRRARRT